MNAAIIENPAHPSVQAIFLRAHMRMLAAGMSPSRGINKGVLLVKATMITGVKYKRGEYAKAAEDLNNYIRGVV